MRTRNSYTAPSAVHQGIRGHHSMTCNRQKKWLVLLATGGVLFQLASCIGEAIFLVAPLIV